MNKFLWHIVKKDLRRFRWIWVAWWLLLLVQASIFAFTYANRGDARHSLVLNSAESLAFMADAWGQMQQRIMFCFWAVNRCITLYLVVCAIQEDTPLGDRAFWRTRPLSGASLVTAKALFIGLVTCGGPGVIQWILPLTVGFKLSAAFAALCTFLEIQAGWITVAALITVLWRKVIFGMVALLILTVIPLVLATFFFYNNYFAWSDASMQILYHILVATGTAATVLMYLSRHRRGAFVVLGVGVADAYLLGTSLAPESITYSLLCFYPYALVTVSVVMLIIRLAQPLSLRSANTLARTPPGV